MAKRMWDLIVVGAGPAGSTAALSALRSDPRASVLLLDAAAFPRDKVCGDGVAPHALDVLRELGVDVDLLVAGTRPITRLRMRSPGGVVASRAFARPAHVVPRELFDDRLVRAAVAAGAVLQRRRVRAVQQIPGGVMVDGDLRGRTVIGADGCESVVRRESAARAAPPGTLAIAVRGYAPAHPWPANEQLLAMTRIRWPAYAWAFPIGNGLANVGYGELLQGTAPTREHLARRLHELLPNAEPGPLRGHRLPLSTGRPDVGHGRLLLVGDAASLINPLTGEGIYYAVLSGALAGRAAALAADPARTYRQSLRGALGSHLRQTDLIARLGRWPILLDIGADAARERQPVFDKLIDFGLGDGRIGPAIVPAFLKSGLRLTTTSRRDKD
jgi:geranylgeranyl reductase family protein